MARPEYPLEALRQLRDERVEAQKRALAGQVARCQAAEAQVRERERARREYTQRVADSLRDEGARLAAGEVSGADLARLSDFEAAARAQAAGLERAELEARAVLTQERALQEAERQKLAELEADAELVRRHEADFRQQHVQAAEKADEEAALEQWNARRH